MPAIDVDAAALLLVDTDRVPPETSAELRRLNPSRVIVLGGESAISQPTLDAVDAISRATPMRLGGLDRYQTADAIDGYARPRDQAGEDPTTYAVSGNDWREAMMAGPAVARDDARLLLINTTVAWPPPDITAAVEIAQLREGRTSFSVRGTTGGVVGLDAERSVAAVSTLKIMFMLAHLRQPDVADRELAAADLALLEPMITESDNPTASTINRQLGAGPLLEIAAEVGMQDFVYVPTPWGNTQTSARDQMLLMERLPDLIPARHRDYALDLLTRVVPEQRWGYGQVELPGWTVYFKGGWGSATGSVNHQSVRLEHRDGAVVTLAVMTTNSPSHLYASDTLELVFAALLGMLP